VLQQLFFAANGLGSFKLEGKAAILELLKLPGKELLQSAQRLPLTSLPKNYTIIASRSHLSREVNDRLDSLRNLYGTVDILYVGSSIKQCWVAEGRAHEYPRYGLTMEWDTAAGQCILEEAGSQLIDLVTDAPMRYNKEDLRNNFFIAKNGNIA
jgi:3'(2'), 5'-bisphosphate nucleotidase